MMSDLGLSFARPQALWLLLLIPVIAVLGYKFGRRRGVRPAATWLRVASVALLTFALAEPMVSAEDSASSTVFVIDRSSSLDAGTASSITDWVNEALDSAGASDRAAVISFGASPELTSPSVESNGVEVPAAENIGVDPDATNIESALAMARALPISGDRRLVLISDGAENGGSAINQASQLAADQIPVDVLSVSGVGADDFRIEGLASPDTIWTGESASVLISVSSSEETSGSIEIIVDNDEPVVHEASFLAGISSHTVNIDDLEAGFHAVQVRVVPGSGDDRFVENNEAARSIVVRDAPALLLVSAERSDSTFLRTALEERGALVTETRPGGIPERLSDLSNYDVVLLNNVPAAELTIGQVAALDSLTREFGRGLIVIGGTSAYGPGGYANTTLEEILPVSVKVTEGKEQQRVALLLIVDKSGSMAYDPLQTSSKIDMAKEAVRLAGDALSDGDEIGILVFNDKQHWVVEMTVINGSQDRERISARIDTISADGGTEIYPALDVGFAEISQSDADVRHIVLLSDGKSSTGTRESYDKLISEIRDSNTTLSTIAIGDDADTDLLQFLAEQGNGNYHPTERPEDIPLLTLAEAQSAGSQSVIRGSFSPIQVASSPIMADFEPEALRTIGGYNYSEPKPDAQVILTSAREDPILAKWQLGLGRVVAWTADDGVDFAADWRAWDRYGEFWASVVRWTLPDPENGPVTVDVAREGSDALVTVATESKIGDYVDLSTARATITAPDGAVTADLPLYQSAPGEYQIRVADPAPGAYQFDLSYSGTQPDQTVLAGFAIPASPELQPASGSDELMASIAGRTGGRTLSFDEPGSVFDVARDNSDGMKRFEAIWWIPLLVALGLLLVEIASRYQFLSQFSRLRRR
jgi:Mg-chelatase subunit ChlD